MTEVQSGSVGRRKAIAPIVILAGFFIVAKILVLIRFAFIIFVVFHSATDIVGKKIVKSNFELRNPTPRSVCQQSRNLLLGFNLLAVVDAFHFYIDPHLHLQEKCSPQPQCTNQSMSVQYFPARSGSRRSAGRSPSRRHRVRKRSRGSGNGAPTTGTCRSAIITTC